MDRVGSPREIRLAIVGSGQISDRFMGQAAQLAGVEMVAVASRHIEHARAKAAQYGIPNSYDDYHAMMDMERPDGVVVATPHSVHAEVALAAFERGLSALVEKPMATSLQDCRDMVASADRSGCTFMCLPYDLYPAVVKAAEFIREEYIGKFTGAEAQLSFSGPHRDNWYYQSEISHGGAVLDCLPYPVSRLITLLGPVRRVTALCGTLIPNRIVGGDIRIRSDVDDNVTLIMEYAGGQQAVVRVLWGMAMGQNNTIVYGRKGTVALNDPGAPALVVQSPEKVVEGAETVTWRGVQACYAPKLPDMTAEQDIVGHFVHSLRTGEEPSCSGQFQLHVHEVLFGAYESARSGRTYEMTTSLGSGNRLPAGFYDTVSDFI